MKYIKSPLFYMGNKYELLEQLLPLFPKKIGTFYDLFGGSGVVTLNAKAERYVYNEQNKNIVELLKIFKNYDFKFIINKIEKNVRIFNLPKMSCDTRTKHYTKEYKDKHNDNYLKFREYYNNKEERDYLDLYTLTYFSFCNLIRFNKKNQFNMPFGNRCYLPEHKIKIEESCNILSKRNIDFKSENAFEILENTKFYKDDFIYLDPPYTNTTAIYNENRAYGGWNVEDDNRLFCLLENLDRQNIKWGLSNVFKNKGKTNNHLIEWCKKNNWYVFHLKKNYASLGKGNAQSDEVYISNYSNGNNQKQMSIFDYE